MTVIFDEIIVACFIINFMPQETSSDLMNPRNQKNFLRKHLQRIFGNQLDIEISVDDIKSNNSIEKADYKKINNALSKFRGHQSFMSKNRNPECDFLIKQKRIIVEYDERQHFTKARAICLQNYPKDVELFYDINTWLDLCVKTNAKDNDPIDRDETRAFYDSVRDIEAFRNGWYLIRFYHGEIDWSARGAIKQLKNRIESVTKKNIKPTVIEPRILRLLLKSSFEISEQEKFCRNAFNFIAKNISVNDQYDYLVTPGGYLNFDWPSKLCKSKKTASDAELLIKLLQKEANYSILTFWNTLPIYTRSKLRSLIKYITFGIDSNDFDDNGKIIQAIELVALFDTKKSKVIHWTGKSYPTPFNKKSGLIEYENIESHFLKINKEMICLLGCHDLKMVSPRAKALAGIEKQKKIKAFDKLMKMYKPNLILQHPHTTDTYKIWNTEWKTIEKIYPFVTEYASGIRYYNFGKRKRGKLSDVIDKTAKGRVETIQF